MVKDRHIDKEGATALKHLVIPVPTAISLTGVVAFKYTPGYAFRVVGVTSYCRVKAGACSGKVKIATRETVAALAYTTATEVAATLSTTIADLLGAADEALSLELTTDGSGVLTNGVVVVTIRPQGLRGD